MLRSRCILTAAVVNEGGPLKFAEPLFCCRYCFCCCLHEQKEAAERAEAEANWARTIEEQVQQRVSVLEKDFALRIAKYVVPLCYGNTAPKVFGISQRNTLLWVYGHQRGPKFVVAKPGTFLGSLEIIFCSCRNIFVILDWNV